jgi:quinol-cytochrome oxidoreductase complex cytochrome b subunit
VSEFRLEKNSDAKAVPKRIALIRRETPARLLEDREESLMTAPHLLIRELILLQVCLILLTVAALLFNAPLEGIADPSTTPNPAKAPWYFLGLQELLAYFHPTVAGALVPLFVLVGAALIPFVDRENIRANRPSDRKTAVVLFTLFCTFGLVLTFLGIFFRGPGYAFTLPWINGFHFSL